MRQGITVLGISVALWASVANAEPNYKSYQHAESVITAQESTSMIDAYDGKLVVVAVAENDDRLDAVS